jgi:hypothetical protein
MPTDWNQPTTSSLYTDILALLEARDVDAFTLGLTDPTNKPTGAIRWNRGTKKFQEWSGAAWADLDVSTGLGLGTMAVQNSNNVSISGGSIGTGVNIDASRLTSGTVALARLANIANAQIDAAAAIAWSKLSKSGSSLADLATRSAGDLNSGTLPLARLVDITNAEIAAAAAIAWSKISKSGSSLADLATRLSTNLTDVSASNWTPHFNSTDSNMSNPTYTTTDGFYFRIGVMVFVAIHLTLDGFDFAGSGGLIVDNLPFGIAAGAGYPALAVPYYDGFPASSCMVLIGQPGASYFGINRVNGASGASMVDTGTGIPFGGQWQLIASGWYATDDD